MTRREFHPKVMIAAWDRADGRCEMCGPNSLKLIPGDIFYDHRVPDALGGEPTLHNCQVLCRAHHDAKTFKTDVPAIAKTKRIRRREAGIRKPRTITRWRKFDGTIVQATRER